MRVPKPLKLPKPRKRQYLHGEPVTWTILREYVLDRDKACIAYRMDHDHSCRDYLGTPHDPYDRSKLTLDHVTREAGGMKGKRPDDDEKHLVAACYGANVGVPSKELRAFERAYLDGIEYDRPGP